MDAPRLPHASRPVLRRFGFSSLTVAALVFLPACSIDPNAGFIYQDGSREVYVGHAGSAYRKQIDYVNDDDAPTTAFRIRITISPKR